MYPTFLSILGFLAVSVSAQWFPQFLSSRLTGSSFGVTGQNATYDYVIIGGGTAGSVVAARLVQETQATVAVIEAGSFYELTNGNLSQVPYWSHEGADLSWQPLNDWGLVAEPDPGANGRSMHYAQGKCLGGSTGRNQMLYNRGTKGSYSLWADEVGDQSYTWENMLPFFQKSISFSPPQTAVRGENATANYSANAFANSNGPLQLSFPNYPQPLSSYGSAAYAAAGFPPSEDHISGTLNGYGYFMFTIDPSTGIRSSAESSFLSPSMLSDRLTVYISSMAQRIVFDSSQRATGVEIRQQGLDPYLISARKEVILSAGVMRSPHLLMLSGVGPNATLSKYGISIVSALEGVGQNMHDTCSIGGLQFGMSTPDAGNFKKTNESLWEANAAYLENGRGPLSSTGADFVGWEKLPEAYRANFTNSTVGELSQWPEDWPEVEIVLSSSGDISAGNSGSSATLYVGTVSIQLVATLSRGNVTINSSSVEDNPVIHTNFFSSQTDQEVAVAAYRRAMSIAENLDCRTSEILEPSADILASNDDLLQYIKESGVNPIHHGSSTCRMGRDGDDMAVVDSKGRVFGVTGLRVIDSSSFRHTPPGHTQAATYAHAEKLVADVITENADRN